MEKIYEILTRENNPKLSEAQTILNGIRDKIIKTKEDYHFMIKLEAELLRENWKISKKKDTTLGVVKIPNTPTVTCLVQSELNVDPLTFVAVHNEATLYNTWIPNCKESG